MSKKNTKISFLDTILNLFRFNKKNQMGSLEDEVLASPGKVILRNFFHNKLAIIGIVMFSLMLLFVFGVSTLYPLDIYHTEPVLKNLAPGTNYLDIPKELINEGIKKIDVGASFAAGISNENNLYVWGSNVEDIQNIPEEVKDKKIVDVACGDMHIIVVDENGKIYGWGNNAFEQARSPFQYEMQINSEGIKKIQAGDQYSAVLTNKNNLYVWGSVLSSGLDVISKEIQGHIEDFEVTSYNILLLLDDGTLTTIGVKGNEVSNIPTELTDGSVKVEQIELSYRNGLALDDKGNLHVWGNKENGMTSIPEFEGNVVDLSAGRNNFTVLLENGDLVSWGSNVYGETEVSEYHNVKDIYQNFFATYAVNEDGSVDAWGLKGFLMGSDELGRELFVRLAHGGRLSLFVGLIAVVITTIIGVIVGLISGFYGGFIDNILMRFGEIISSLPFIPLAITLSSLVDRSMSQDMRLFMIMCILGVLSWPGLARMVRGQILSEREKDFVLAAKSLGLKQKSIIIKHILPNVINIVIVSMTLQYAGSLLTEAGLSFLGFGVIPPQPSWGNMLSAAQQSEVVKLYYWRWMIPAFCVLISAFSINLIGDALRDAMDPKSNEK